MSEFVEGDKGECSACVEWRKLDVNTECCVQCHGLMYGGDDEADDDGFMEADDGECMSCGEYRKLDANDSCVECFRHFK